IRVNARVRRLEIFVRKKSRIDERGDDTFPSVVRMTTQALEDGRRIPFVSALRYCVLRPSRQPPGILQQRASSGNMPVLYVSFARLSRRHEQRIAESGHALFQANRRSVQASRRSFQRLDGREALAHSTAQLERETSGRRRSRLVI